MKGRLGLVAVILIGAVCFCGSVAVAQDAGSTDFRAFWKDGLRLETGDKNFKFSIGGRIMLDFAWFDADSALETELDEIEDGTEFRRARLYVAGTIYERVIFKAQYDFAGGDADFKDVYIGITKIGGTGTLKVGHFKEPFGLEELTSSKYITFMERSLPAVFTPGRNTGAGFSSHALDKRVTWAAGVYRDADGFGEFSGGGEYNITARVTGLPWYEDGGDKLLHVGAAYSRKSPVGDTVRFRERPEAHPAPRFVDTEEFESDSVGLLGLEAAFVYGSLSVQGEYIFANVDSAAAADPEFTGRYIQASYFVTGEHRPYKTSAGSFSRVKPNENFLGGNGGLGAVEIAVRYSSLDLTDAGIDGGELDDLTIGVNWYLNPNARVMLNYVNADLDGVGKADIVMTRFQIDF